MLGACAPRLPPSLGAASWEGRWWWEPQGRRKGRWQMHRYSRRPSPQYCLCNHIPDLWLCLCRDMWHSRASGWQKVTTNHHPSFLPPLPGLLVVTLVRHLRHPLLPAGPSCPVGTCQSTLHYQAVRDCGRRGLLASLCCLSFVRSQASMPMPILKGMSNPAQKHCSGHPFLLAL